MRIKKYTALFHDGAIRKIRHAKNKIELSMESAQVCPEWNEDNIILSKRSTISGKFYLENAKNIKENDNPYQGNFEVKSGYDRAGIYDFEIKSSMVILLIWWVKWPPNCKDSDIFKYEIEAGKIYWENIPDLFDEYWEEQKMR